MSNFTNNIQNQTADGSRLEARGAGRAAGKSPLGLQGTSVPVPETPLTHQPETSIAVSAAGTGAVDAVIK